MTKAGCGSEVPPIEEINSGDLKKIKGEPFAFYDAEKNLVIRDKNHDRKVDDILDVYGGMTISELAPECVRKISA
jgi:hypothetical protein